MTNNHTPGPWAFYTEPQPNGCPIVGARGLMVAMLAHSVNEAGQKETALANAELIASSPEMKEALDFLAGLHPGLTIDGPPMEIAKRIFDTVLAERSELKERIQNMERNLATIRSVLAKTTRTA